MRKKFSITTKLDTDKLTTQILKFISEYQYEPYIFVNSETLQDLEDFYVNQLTGLRLKNTTNKTAYYQGCRMFTDNSLNYGEIELR